MDDIYKEIFLETPKVIDGVIEDQQILFIPGLYVLEVMIDGGEFMCPRIDQSVHFTIRDILEMVRNTVEDSWNVLVIIENGPMCEYTYTYNNKTGHWTYETNEGYA